MFGSTEMYEALNVAGIYNLLDEFNGDPAIFDDVIISRDMDVGAKTINFYRTSARPCGVDYEIYNYTINCRAQTQGEAQTIANAVIENINRIVISDYNIVCTLLAVIPPADERDNYNCPIEAVIKLR